jgi:hypothetical protein
LCYKSCNNLLNLYNKGLLALFFNGDNLNIPGNKYIKKGDIKEIQKLDDTFKRRCVCVFLYTAQKHPK